MGVDFMENKHTKESIKQLLLSNKNALYRGLITIYMMQTQEEKNKLGTIINNGVGFGSFDSEFLSSIAEKILRKQKLSNKETILVQAKMMKYAGQLAKLSNQGIKEQVDRFIRKYEHDI